jgi:predicted dehydrogenase
VTDESPSPAAASSPSWSPPAEPAAPSPGRPLRFGLVGTGYWAQVAHARALASAPGIEFAAVWGRNTEAAAALAAEHGVTAHLDFDAFLGDVDGVAFSVPPDVQSELAVRAAEAGKHLLLEKPVALTEAAAEALAAAVQVAGVASVVFFTCRFQPDISAWLEQLATAGGWQGASALWLGSAYSQASPFNTPWRQAKGGLWDLGPHTLSLVWAILGPVESVTADAGRGDVTHLVLHHQGGATSTVTVTLGAPEAADGFDLRVWGERGRAVMPPLADDPVVALRTALSELIDSARSPGLSHPCDVEFGLAVTRILAAAQRQIDGTRQRMLTGTGS